MIWLVFLLLAAILLAGLYITLLNAPGLWVMALATLLYAWLTHFQYVGWISLAVIFLLAGIAELIDTLASGAAAKRAGAGKAGVFGAIIGGILGGIFLTISIPFAPGVGTILGVCLGTFVGALIGEMAAGTELGLSLRAGVGAVKGRLIGMFTKLLFGCVILGIVLWLAMPLPGRHRKAAATSVPPVSTSHPTTTGSK
jgi:uncharacterized protein YqgC (DUF456 family)